MTTFYLSPSGNDANNGLGPDASHTTNKPWLMLAKAMATGSSVVPGDTIYCAPGTYYSTSVTVIAGIASSASPTAFRGDPTNAQGFKDGSGVRLASGPVWFTQRTAAEGMDGDVAATAFTVNAQANGTSGVQFYNVVLEGGNFSAGGAVALSYNANADWLIEGCRLVGRIGVRHSTGAPTAARNLTVRQCVILGGLFDSSGTTAAATANADLNILAEANLIIGRFANNMQLGAVAGNLAGGIRFKGNTVISTAYGTICLQTVASGVSTVTPIRVEGNIIIGGGAGISAGTAGHVVSDGYNRFNGANANVNFTALGTDKSNVALQVVLPDLLRWGLVLPTDNFLGWTADAPATVVHSGFTSTQPGFRGRTARPWGGGASIGYLETPDIAQDTTSAITGGGANSLKITGAGEASLFVPVAAAATTITIVTKSSLYGGASYPQLIMEASPAAGVTATTATASSAAEQTLTIGPFTPTAAGVVELRLVSRSTATNSSTWFDLLAAS